MTRICIVGGPRTGKTTLACTLFERERCNCSGVRVVYGQTYGMHARECDAWLPDDIRLRHTDDLIAHHDWSAASLEASKWLDEPGPWIIEGVALSRALRKWRDAHPGEPAPVDKIIRLTVPHVSLTKGQTTMAKGEETVFSEILRWLLECGVSVVVDAPIVCEHPGYNGKAAL